MEGNQNTNKTVRGQRRTKSSLRQRIKTRTLLNIAGGVLLICAFIFFALNDRSQGEAAVELKEVEQIQDQTSSHTAETQTVEEKATEEVFATEAASDQQRDTEAASPLVSQATQQSRSTLSPQRAASVQWSQVAAEVEGMAAVLNWTTLSEYQSQTFAVERSLDNSTFEKIGQIKAKGQDGAKYSFTDNELSELHMPLVFYRIKHLDAEGNALLSQVVEKDLNFQLGAYVRVFPSAKPAQMTIRYAADMETIFSLQVLDGTGEVIVEKDDLPAELIPHDLQLDIAGWEKGTYYLQLFGPENSVTETFEVR